MGLPGSSVFGTRPWSPWTRELHQDEHTRLQVDPDGRGGGARARGARGLCPLLQMGLRADSSYLEFMCKYKSVVCNTMTITSYICIYITISTQSTQPKIKSLLWVLFHT